jgi:hypothetical protein
MLSMTSNNPGSKRVGKLRQKTTASRYYSTILRLLCEVGYRRQTLFLEGVGPGYDEVVLLHQPQ